MTVFLMAFFVALIMGEQGSGVREQLVRAFRERAAHHDLVVRLRS